MSNYWIIANDFDVSFLKELGVIIDKEILNSDVVDEYSNKAHEFHATISDEVEEKLNPYFYRFVWGPLSENS